jgi:hypothetical protein
MEAIGLTGPDGDRAILVRRGSDQRALMTADSGERLIFSPLDSEVDVRADGDALAAWLASAPVTGGVASGVPAWASVAGLVLLLLVAAFTLIGGAVALGWVLELFSG